MDVSTVQVVLEHSAKFEDSVISLLSVILICFPILFGLIFFELRSIRKEILKGEHHE